LRQFHSADAVLVKSGQDAALRPDADAHVTSIAEHGLAILVADCTPVLFADRVAGVIGAAHAGWRGACGGVVEATIRLMCESGANTENITAVIGPCIRQDSYQVGNDLRDAVLNSNSEAEAYFVAENTTGKYRFDLAGYVTMRLAKAGIGAIEDCQRDTYGESDQFFSHRFATHAGDSDSGRLISVIALQSIMDETQGT
jgi:YfiH family protein